MKNLPLLVTFIILTTKIFCQFTSEFPTLSDSTLFYVEKIADRNSYEAEMVGYSGIMPDQWKNYLGLLRHTTDEDLQLLTDHSSPAVRCYTILI